MQADNGGQGLPMKPRSGKVKFNSGALVTLLLIIAIIVVLGLILDSLLGWGILSSVKSPKPKIKDASPTGLGSASVDEGGDAGASYAETPLPLRPEAPAEGRLPVFYRAGGRTSEIALCAGGVIKEKAFFELLDYCQENGVKLTFFPSGEELKANPEPWQQAFLQGHEIESRGYSGKMLGELGEKEMGAELEKVTEILHRCLNPEYRLHFLRAGMGDDENEALNDLLISMEAKGFASQAVLLNRQTTIEEIVPGVVVYIDLGGELNLSEIEFRIDLIRQQGLKSVTMNELFGYENNCESGGETE